MNKTIATLLSSAFLMTASAAFAADDGMKKDCAKDAMSKDCMAKDEMKKDMPKEGMKQEKKM